MFVYKKNDKRNCQTQEKEEDYLRRKEQRADGRIILVREGSLLE